MLSAACSSSVASPVCKHCWPTHMHSPVTGYVITDVGGGGHSLKICDGYVRPHWPPGDPHFQTACHWMTLFIFHILLSPIDPHFQNALSLRPNELTPFLEIFIGENGRHALTEWRRGGGGVLQKIRTGMLKVEFKISTISIPRKAWFCDPSLYHLSAKSTQFGANWVLF